MMHTIDLATGRLSVRVERSVMPLEELTGFAARNNPKRGFLFLSRVLGKHVPVRPSLMSRVHKLLAGEVSACLDRASPVLVVGMAETATALGQGVFAALGEPDSLGLYLNTTRYKLPLPRLTFMESHSHASTHYLHLPHEAELKRVLNSARTLILVDDEMSTGNTFVNLSRSLVPLLPGLTNIVIATLLDWLGQEARRDLYGRMPLPTGFASLLSGGFSFSPNPSFIYGAPAVSERPSIERDDLFPLPCGRRGVGQGFRFAVEEQLRKLALPSPDKAGALLILGTGEFMYEPFLLALRLENMGYDVHFQATTRSPILPGNDVDSVLRFDDNYGERIDNFLYNVRPGQYSRIFLCCETGPLPADHVLPRRLGSEIVQFGESVAAA